MRSARPRRSIGRRVLAAAAAVTLTSVLAIISPQAATAAAPSTSSPGPYCMLAVTVGCTVPNECTDLGYGTSPMSPAPVTAEEGDPGVITLTVTRPACSGDAPFAWFYVYDNYGGGHQYHIVDNGLSEQTCQIPLPHAFQPGDGLDVVHAYAVNSNVHASATADSNSFTFTGPVDGVSGPLDNPCIG